MSQNILTAAEVIYDANAATTAPATAVSYLDAYGRVNGLRREQDGAILLVELDESTPDDDGDWLYMWSMINADGEYIIDNQCGTSEEVTAALLAFAVCED